MSLCLFFNSSWLFFSWFISKVYSCPMQSISKIPKFKRYYGLMVIYSQIIALLSFFFFILVIYISTCLGWIQLQQWQGLYSTYILHPYLQLWEDIARCICCCDKCFFFFFLSTAATNHQHSRGATWPNQTQSWWADLRQDEEWQRAAWPTARKLHTQHPLTLSENLRNIFIVWLSRRLL